VPGRGPEDGRIDWNSSAIEVHNLVRAVSDPFPGAFTAFDGRIMKIWSAHPSSSSGSPEVPGRVLVHPEGGDAMVACGGGAWLVLDEIQWADGERLRGADLVASLSGVGDHSFSVSGESS